jgi:hypothetical protein
VAISEEWETTEMDKYADLYFLGIELNQILSTPFRNELQNVIELNDKEISLGFPAIQSWEHCDSQHTLCYHLHSNECLQIEGCHSYAAEKV